MNEALYDIPRVNTAVCEWFACLIYIFMLNRRIQGIKLIGALGLFFIFQTVFFIFTDNVPIDFWIPCMAVAVGFMFCFIQGCTTVGAKDAAYYSVHAFVLAELIASMVWQVYLYTLGGEGEIDYLVFNGIFAVFLLFIALLAFILKKRQILQHSKLAASSKELMITGFIGVVVFFFSNISFAPWDTPFSGSGPLDAANVRTLVDLCGFAVLFSHYVLCTQVRARRELEAIQGVLHNQYAQYQQSRESIDMINRKYHDLKHQIAALRTEKDPGKRTEWLDAMESDIIAYEAENKTGNSVLDTILTSKSLYCQKHGITLTCVADGTLLAYMDVMDICTIFGNALDNAIESERKIADKTKRLIHVTVSKQKDFILLRFENYFEEAIVFEGELPCTTKRNRDFHGYGLKNIKYVAGKYNGAVSINTEKNWFDLKILLPMGQ